MQFERFIIAVKALRQLGINQVALNALYRIGLATGHYRRAIQPSKPVDGLRLRPIMPLPGREKMLGTLGEGGLDVLLSAADEIANGRFRFFGAEPAAIELCPEKPLGHWTEYETGKIGHKGDIKFTWEPARFGWAFVLGRAYHASGAEKYAEAFWQLFTRFQDANPAYQGPNWISGQEVGLRLLAFIWAAQVFGASGHSSAERLTNLANAVATHAARIPATLIYARSQNNNHLLTEAVALYSAGLALRGQPLADEWKAGGEKWLRWCFTNQIGADGEYVQHSSNYQRLILQCALWVNAIGRIGNPAGEDQVPGMVNALDDTSRKNLVNATHWLIDRLDPESGRAANLGANDGALIFPFSNGNFNDFRPVALAASRAFLDQNLDQGGLDEMALWFGLEQAGKQPVIRSQSSGTLITSNSWCNLRAVHYRSRPSHADQLHADLWWRGFNIAQDAGTYLYNGKPPWDNRLTSTLVHNTVSVDGQEQMTRASRFLYLDWANATYGLQITGPTGNLKQISASSDMQGVYARLKVRHERMITVFKDERWLVDDRLTNTGSAMHVYRLHWLLPDWEWELQEQDTGLELRLNSPHGQVRLVIGANKATRRFGILRAGNLLRGEGLSSPVFGWVSHTYSVKVPAISLAMEVQSEQDVHFNTEFIFPEGAQRG